MLTAVGAASVGSRVRLRARARAARCTQGFPLSHAVGTRRTRGSQEQPTKDVELFVSFGGLLMRLKGDARHLAKLSLDMRVYLLIRKIQQS